MRGTRFVSIDALRQAYRGRQVSPGEVVQDLVRRMDRLGEQLNCFLSRAGDLPEQARRLERLSRSQADALPLYGIPFSVKDLIHTRDLPTTAGSRVDFSSQERRHDAAVVQALRDAGALLIGKNSLHEFAFGITNENEHYGPARNPWNLSRMTGGSSGGSAAAVVAGLGAFSIGTDTRGSIRIPSACCGATGFKPTRGRVSTRGVFPLSWTLDHVGPLACSVEDIRSVLPVIERRRRASAESLPRRAKTAFAGLRLGLCDYYLNDLNSEVRECLERSRELFAANGAVLLDVELPILEEALIASDHISRAEAVAIHDAYLTRQGDRYGPHVAQRLRTGYAVSGMELARALQTREQTIRRFRAAFRRVDCLLTPGLPVPAPPLGTQVIGPKYEPIVAGFVRLHAPQNVAGLPALVLPGGRSSDGLPLGLQLIAGAGRDDLLLEVGARYQQLTDWHRAIPPL